MTFLGAEYSASEVSCLDDEIARLTTVGKMTIPELRKRGYPEKTIIGTLAGSATLGLMIPPSLTLIVYGLSFVVFLVMLAPAAAVVYLLPGAWSAGGIVFALVFAWAVKAALASGTPCRPR